MKHSTVSTYAPRQTLSRLGQFRLKRAQLDRAEAIRAAEERYTHDVSAILTIDRDAVLATRRGERANWRNWKTPWREPAQVLCNPFGAAIPPRSETGCPDPHWMCFPRQLLRRWGFREVRRV